MRDAVGLAIIAFLVMFAVIGLRNLSKPYNISEEEFEKRVHDGPGLIGAGLVGLQKALDPAMSKAAEVQQDFRKGRYDKEQGSGEPPETGNSTKPTSNTESTTGEGDA